MKPINWSIKIDETEFQELFELYWNAGKDSPQRLFVMDELKKYTYFYLTSRPYVDFDIASDFFVEIMGNTKKFLEEYEPAYYISFLVYFTSRVKRRLNNYRGKIQERKKYENVNEYYELNPEHHSESVFESMNDYCGNTGNIRTITEFCLSKLGIDEEIAIKLYYGFSLNYKNFRYLVRKGGRRATFVSYRKYLSCLNNKSISEKKMRESVFQKLYIVNINLRDNYDINCRRKRERLLKSLAISKGAAPLRLIAEIFATSITNVYRKIRRGRKKLEQLLRYQLYINFDEIPNDTIENPDIEKAA
ncbi:MAG: hypothetical protein OEV66_05630 [Spirochaetia bacterium]|nr:hypothetical protein [Spirochaetia bacterium]